MLVPSQPLHTRSKSRTLLVVLAIIIGTPLVGALGIGPKVAEAEAYTWGPWSTPRYYAVAAAECDMAKAANKKYLSILIGPPSPAAQAIGCRQKLRWRKANIAGKPAPWKDMMFQIDNVGPFGGYGMQLLAAVRWNGTRVHADEPICREWSFVVTVTRQTCSVVNNDTARLWLRMDYKVGWTFLWMNAQNGRGATIDISRSGWTGPVVRWP